MTAIAKMTTSSSEAGLQRAVDVQSASKHPTPSDVPGDTPASRFGAAADMVDRLDLQPLADRTRCRPWWKLR